MRRPGRAAVHHDDEGRRVLAIPVVSENKKISILGLTFKPETDDLRSSPALDAIKILLQKKASISVFDPIFKLKPG